MEILILTFYHPVVLEDNITPNCNIGCIVITANTGVRISLVFNICDYNNCLTIIDNVQNSFVVAIIGYVWQPSWILKIRWRTGNL